MRGRAGDLPRHDARFEGAIALAHFAPPRAAVGIAVSAVPLIENATPLLPPPPVVLSSEIVDPLSCSVRGGSTTNAPPRLSAATIESASPCAVACPSTAKRP